VVQSGVLADEFIDVGAGTFPADRRVITMTNTDYPFEALSLARIDALRAVEVLERYRSESPAPIGELFALAGFVNVMFAENLCAPVPLALVNDGVPSAAPGLARVEMLDGARALFDSAAAYGMGNDTIMNLARLGQARALLDLDDPVAAAQVAAQVPLNFRYQLPYSETIKAQVNRVYQATVTNRSLSVADREGGNGLAFITGQDPRVVAQLAGTGRNGQPLYNFVANQGLGAPITLATGVEALLLKAESSLRAQKVQEWADALNQLRETAITSAMPPLSSDSTISASPEERIAITFRERAFWLFATGRRHGDLRRLVRQYGLPVEAVFPTGEYLPTPGLRYGTDVTFLLRGEEPNRTFAGCMDREP
jgi:hypothetical protein